MKKPDNIRDRLGLTQLEMALLLGISRSHYSMFESGKRDLPLHAKQKLAETLAHVQSSESPQKKTKQDSQALRDHLKSLLDENEYKRLLVQRKIASLNKKQVASQRVLQLSRFLAQKNPTKASETSAFRQSSDTTHIPTSLADKTAKAARADFASELMKLHVKLELLESEMQFIAAKLKAGS